MPTNKKSKCYVRVVHANETRTYSPIHATPDSQLSLPGLVPGDSTCMVMPKHIALPPMPSDGPFLFESIVFAYTTLNLCLQYLNLYRTVWWLPHSHNKYAINFYLIDEHLACFIVVLFGRRFVWCCIRLLIVFLFPTTISNFVLPKLRWLVYIATALCLVTLVFKLSLTHPIVNTFYLLYPVSIYVVLFGSDVQAFFELLPPAVNKPGLSVASTLEVKHVCSSVADNIRNEVAHLKTDFNSRLKRVLFNSLLCAYYVGFVPCCFVPSVLYYDRTWVTRQVVILWVGCFTMYVVHLYPPYYCNVLHCAALHLGCWHKVEGPAAHMPHTSWSESIVWQFGALVKHRKELYRATGIINAAEPGNVSHSRFHAFFRNPSVILSGFVGLQATLVLCQLVLLAVSWEWNHLVSICLPLVAHYYTFFKLSRDYLVLWKIYRMEETLQHKFSK